MSNDSKIPFRLHYFTEKLLSTIKFSSNNIFDIIQQQDPRKSKQSFFLDISKEFDKLWHKRIIFKLKQNDISGEFLNLLCDFLRNRKQSVVLNAKV